MNYFKLFIQNKEKPFSGVIIKKIAPVGAIFYELTGQLITSYHACHVEVVLALP